MNVQLKIIDQRIRDYMPSYATAGSAAIDLRACMAQSVYLWPGEVVKVRTGIAINIEDPGYAAMILPRSGLGSQGLVLGNLVGLIDSDYQGELVVALWNRGQQAMNVDPMDRIAQLVIVPVIQAEFEIVESFQASARGEGGFGSTGKG